MECRRKRSRAFVRFLRKHGVDFVMDAVLAHSPKVKRMPERAETQQNGAGMKSLPEGTLQ